MNANPPVGAATRQVAIRPRRSAPWSPSINRPEIWHE
jgi:hypothetical protein